MNLNTFYVLRIILKSIEQIKGTNIYLIDLLNKYNILFDYIVICSVNSSTQVSSIATLVKETIFSSLGTTPNHIEGHINSQWVLMDYDVILLNIFQKSIRRYYNIESLWLKKLLK